MNTQTHPQNDSMVLVNIVELASELAHQKLTTSILEESMVNPDGTYTEEAQDEFNDYYDEYYDLILSCK